jgi:hypothetical protein
MSDTPDDEHRKRAEYEADKMDFALDAGMNRLASLRGKAIAEFASLEHILCLLFADFTGISEKAASIIFFEALSVNKNTAKVFKAMLKLKHGETYSVFWNSLEKRIAELVSIRNEIVHHTAWGVAFDDGQANIGLMPPTGLYSVTAFEKATKERVKWLSEKGLSDFIEKCSFMWGVCYAFHRFLSPYPYSGDDPAKQPPWPEIFQRRVDYPAPKNHPVLHAFHTLEGQHLPSQESPQPQ